MLYWTEKVSRLFSFGPNCPDFIAMKSKYKPIVDYNKKSMSMVSWLDDGFMKKLGGKPIAIIENQDFQNFYYSPALRPVNPFPQINNDWKGFEFINEHISF